MLFLSRRFSAQGDAPGEAGVTPGRYIPSEHLLDDMEDVGGMGVADIFKVFLAANELAHALHYMDAIREQLGGLYGPAFFQALKDNVTHFKVGWLALVNSVQRGRRSQALVCDW